MDYFLGIDPDTRCMSAVLLDATGKFVDGILRKLPPSPRRGWTQGVLNDGLVAVSGRGGPFMGTDICPLPPADRPWGRLTICAELPRCLTGYASKKGADPQDISNLAFACGVWASEIASQTKGRARCFSEIKVFLPYPQDWKGSADKRIFQNRIAAASGLELERQENGWPLPLIWQHMMRVHGTTETGRSAKIAKGDWKDIWDSYGLALWAAGLLGTANKRASPR